MLSPSINKKGRSPKGRRAQQARPATTSAQQQISAAIAAGEILQLNYQGNPRSIVPLVYGILKNGKKAILCYKINHPSCGFPEMALRLYHLDKVSHLQGTGHVREVNRKIDYYLTKHFASVYQKC